MRLTGFTGSTTLPSGVPALAYMNQINITQPEADVTTFPDTWQQFIATDSAKRLTAQVHCVPINSSMPDAGSANIVALLTGATIAVTLDGGVLHEYVFNMNIRNVQEVYNKRTGSYEFILDVGSTGNPVSTG